MKKEKSPILPVIFYMLKTAKQEKPILFFSYFLNFLIEIIRTGTNLLLPKLIIDELFYIYNDADVAFHLIKVIIFALATVFLHFFANILGGLTYRIRDVCNEWFEEYFQVKVNEQVMSLDFEQTENPEVLNQMNKAKEGISWYSGNVCGILDQIQRILTSIIILFTVIVLITSKSPLILPIQIVSMKFLFFFSKKIRQIEIESFKGLAKTNRIFGYMFFQLSDFQYGKDIRMYNSAPLFTKRSGDHLLEQEKIWTKQAEGTQKQQMSMNFVTACASFLSYFYVGFKTVKKSISLGDFSMCISACNTLTTCWTNIVNAYQEILKRVSYANEYLTFMNYPCEISKGTKDVDFSKNHEIEFKHVYFKYPRSEKFILKDINLKITSGQHLAVVGLNGAGKTTFIKLLCRLYDVTDGEILIDGINIKEYKDDEYRKLFAIVFQDFKLFRFTVRENVTFSSDTKNDEKLFEVLKQSGLANDVENLPKKADTWMWKIFDKKGVEFSGGQQQKLAIARALYKDSPIVILDEPTAALDPIAEADIYNRFNTTLAGGKTAVYISHRLSSCKFCDKIAVFSEGTIKEYGNHDELMKLKNGVYQQMFTTQAKQYK